MIADQWEAEAGRQAEAMAAWKRLAQSRGIEIDRLRSRLIQALGTIDAASAS